MRDIKLRGAVRERIAGAAGDQADLVAKPFPHTQPGAVANVKTLDLDPPVVKNDATVGHDPVHVQAEKLDVCGHLS